MTENSNQPVVSEVTRLGDLLAARGQTLALAESCTGGWVAKLCTDVPGSSAWFECGYVTYSNQAKHRMLGVSETTLAENGAVSEPVVREMVQGALQRSGAEWALAISGIAGPGGGTDSKPVGTVWFAWAGPGDGLQTECVQFDGDRENVRLQSVTHAISKLLQRAQAAH